MLSCFDGSLACFVVGNSRAFPMPHDPPSWNFGSLSLCTKRNQRLLCLTNEKEKKGPLSRGNAFDTRSPRKIVTEHAVGILTTWRKPFLAEVYVQKLLQNFERLPSYTYQCAVVTHTWSNALSLNIEYSFSQPHLYLTPTLVHALTSCLSPTQRLNEREESPTFGDFTFSKVTSHFFLSLSLDLPLSL